MHFSYFTGLWALAALAGPLIIHLWRPPLRLVRLGSLRFLQKLPRQRLHTLRFRERLLLFTRLLLLALIALLLAAPFWRRVSDREPQKWALLAPDTALDGPASKRLNALVSSGYQLRSFVPGFPLVEFRAAGRNLVATNRSKSLDAWSLIRELDASLPPGSSLSVFTHGRMNELRGPRPTLRRCRVRWVQSSGDAEDKHIWIDSVAPATASGVEKLGVVLGVSNPAGTQYISRMIPAQAGRTQVDGVSGRLDLDVANTNIGQFSARLTDTNDQPAGEWVSSEQRAPLHVLIFHGGDRAREAEYLEAAVRAAAQVTGRKLILTSYLDSQPAQNDVPPPGWIFWLSSRAVTEQITHLTAGGWKLVTDAATGQQTLGDSIIVITSDVVSPRLSTDTVTINKRIASHPSNAISWWTDGFGEPLLTRNKIGAGEHLNFLSRFHPAWNDLPRTGALAAMMLSLFNENVVTPSTRDTHDLRIADISQIVPETPAALQSTLTNTPLDDNLTDLHALFWTLGLLCFCAERVLSHRKPRSGREHADSNFKTSASEAAGQ